MTIKRILTGFFAIMLLLCLGQGALTLVKLDSTAQRTTDLLDNAIPSMNEANLINTLVSLIRDEQTSAVRATLVMLCISALIALGAMAFCFLGIARPIERMTGAMRRLANGDAGIEIPGDGRRNEVGAMAATVQVFRDNLIRTRQLEEEIVRNVAQAAAGTEEVTSNITGVAGAAEETGAASAQVLASSSELSRQSKHLTAEVARFLATVRAA